MAEAVDTTSSDSAEKAYAAAAEIAAVKAEAPAAAAPVAAPAEVLPAAVVPAEVAPAIVSPAAELAFPAKTKRVGTAKAAAPVVAKKVPVAVKKPVAAKKVVAAKPVKTAPSKIQTASTSASNPIKQIKETIMATKQTQDFAKTVKTAAADVSAKAKLALAKGSAVFGEASAFTKGNVEAIVTSGKILGTGLQDLGKTYAAEGKSAYETVTADVKELAAVKSPTDFVRLQTSILRRNFDHAFTFGGKNSEAVLKLASEAFAPISARASLAVEKVKKAA